VAGGIRLGMAVMALIIGVGAGLGAVGFRWLVFGATWLATGYEQFGQMGRVASLHFRTGIWFLLLIRSWGLGLRTTHSALCQGSPRSRRPEVMIAVAEDGGASARRSRWSRPSPPLSVSG